MDTSLEPIPSVELPAVPCGGGAGPRRISMSLVCVCSIQLHTVVSVCNIFSWPGLIWTVEYLSIEYWRKVLTRCLLMGVESLTAGSKCRTPQEINHQHQCIWRHIFLGCFPAFTFQALYKWECCWQDNSRSILSCSEANAATVSFTGLVAPSIGGRLS